MKAIIIQDNDARSLLDLLKLENFTNRQYVNWEGADGGRKTVEQISEEVHRRFHFIVCRWLQDQGANVTR